MRKISLILILAIIFSLTSCDKNEDDNDFYEYSTSSFETPKDEIDLELWNESMATHYFSDELSSSEKEIYDFLVDEMRSFTKSIPFIHDASVYTKIFNIIGIEQLDLTYVINRQSVYNNDKKRYDIVFSYDKTESQVNMMNADLQTVATKILSGINEDMSDYDKLKYLHDYIITNSVYDNYSNSIYSVLIDGKGNCEGNAKAFSFLCNLIGIENIVIPGKTVVPHLWNMVKVDGEWYHIDVTWDQPDKAITNDLPGFILYQYFMVDDEVIANYHTVWEMGKELPKATSDKEDYYKKNGYYISGEEDILPVLEKSLEDSISERESYALVKVDSNNLLINVQNEFVEESSSSDGDISKMIERLGDKYNVTLTIDWSKYFNNYRSILFIIKYDER